jgi:putative integral membrane protein (TIGR02587 family)
VGAATFSQSGASRSASDLSNFLIGLGRGGAGALLFAVPMLMTMELWDIGDYVSRSRLLVLLLIHLPLLIVLANRIGFERTFTWGQAVRDALVAYALGIVISAATLALLGILTAETSISSLIGRIAIQSVPASIGALLGRSQLGGGGTADDGDEDRGDDDEGGALPERLSPSFARELFLMAVGALFLNLNVAPTEEVVLIAYKMTAWHALAAIIVSIAIMHAFVYAVSFWGTHEVPEGTSRWLAFFCFTLPGYVVSMIISLYVLWVFGRLDDTSGTQILMSAIVLSFPGAIGAASARLVL